MKIDNFRQTFIDRTEGRTDKDCDSLSSSRSQNMTSSKRIFFQVLIQCQVLMSLGILKEGQILKFKECFQTTQTTKNFAGKYCQARVQVPNPLSQQAPNPDPKVRPSLKKTQNPILWTGADTIITWATTTPPPITFKHE